jgi:S1-C subfamily serine protease
VTTLDWIVLGIVVVASVLGFIRGLVASALSAVGVIVGLLLGGRLAPLFLPGGETSRYTPLVALLGALVGAFLFEGLASLIGSAAREGISVSPLRTLDSFGGLVFGAATGLAIAWALGAVALHIPGQTELRHAVQRSEVLQRLNRIVPPKALLDALERVDTLPALPGPIAPVEPPDPRILQMPGVRTAAPSVVRVVGSACGLAVTGSGWVARDDLVVTAAHVVAGQRDTDVEVPSEGSLEATAVAFDERNDLAVLRVRGLDARPLALADPVSGDEVAILGYPGGGPLDAEPGRIGRTASVVTRDAYGRGPVLRRITTFRGDVRHGNSGGPAVNADGEVETTVFAARIGSDGGFGVPPAIVRSALDGARGRVSTGRCVD